MENSRQLFNAGEMESGVKEIAKKIAARFAGKDADFALVGIQQMGVVLAEKICEEMKALGFVPDFGKLDITMYRDDIGSRSLLPRIYETDIPFDVNDKNIILVDDVLSSGRTIRAALDALTDFGRPGMIKLAVLVDRGEPEFPIHADFAAYSVSIPPEHKVLVTIGEDTAVYEVEWK